MLIPLIAGCAGANTGGTFVPASIGSAPPASAASMTAATGLEENGALAALATAEHLLYVGNLGNNSITVYREFQTGDVTPQYTIAGSATGIDNPGQLAQDAHGDLYVANGSRGIPGTNPAILVFAHGAHGDAAPIRALAGPQTGLTNVAAMTVDAQTGTLFVVDDGMSTGSGAKLLRFAPGAGGNTAPLAAAPISYYGLQLTTDSSGKNLIEAHTPTGFIGSSVGIETLPDAFAGKIAPKPVYDVFGLQTSGIVDDPSTQTYLAATSNGISRFKENAVDTIDHHGGLHFTPAPVSTITSATCGSQLALGSVRETLLTRSAANGCATDAVSTYAHDASGNAGPLRVISGPNTGLNQPYGIIAGP
jgi:hypothetical protein